MISSRRADTGSDSGKVIFRGQAVKAANFLENRQLSQPKRLWLASPRIDQQHRGVFKIALIARDHC